MNKHIGSSLDALLMDENVLEETTEKAMKSIVAMTIKQVLEAEKISKAELAKKLSFLLHVTINKNKPF